jgi:hypothetical protein
MTFTDDLRGLSRAAQIARVQAVARQHGDQLTDREAGDALHLYATAIADPWPAAGSARGRHADPEAGS